MEWAVPFFKGTSRAKAEGGKFRAVILMGLDDSTLVGGPRKLKLGILEALQDPETIALDETGYKFFFKNEPYALNKTLDLKRPHRADCGDCRFVGAVCEFAGGVHNVFTSIHRRSNMWGRNGTRCPSSWPRAQLG